MVATNADCSIWLNHSLRTAASPKTRSKSGSRAAKSSKVSFTSKTQTLFTTFLSKRHGGATLEAQSLASLVRGGGLPVEHLAQGYGLLDQLGVRLRALFAADAQVVFQADPHVSAQHQAHRGKVVLGRVTDAW